MSYILQLIERLEDNTYEECGSIEYSTRQEAVDAGLRACRNYDKAGIDITFEIYHS